jgi:hypothetical protein
VAERDGPCPCWWNGGSLHDGHCCFLGPHADTAFAGLGEHCHDGPAQLLEANGG